MAHAQGIAPDAAAASPPRRHWVALLDAVLGPLVEIPAALLVVAEIIVLLAGVIGRYLFHQPIIWSDELASILFLWLSMLGAVVAFRRGEHMRMTALVGQFGTGNRAVAEAVATAACLAFLAMAVWPSLEFATDEVAITTPALGISN